MQNGLLERRRSRIQLFVGIVLLLSLSASGLACAPQSDDGGTYVVAVTILPQAEFVKAVGGDLVDVLVMVPPGASPHTYEVTPDQMVKLSSARMYARVGPPMEFEIAWMDKFAAANPDMLIVDCSQGIDFIEAVPDSDEATVVGPDGEQELINTGVDPHVWLSVRNAEVMVANICTGLSQVDPTNAGYYERNSAAYIDALSKLDSDLTQSLQSLANRTFIVYHPAFGYFARDYDLTQLGIEQDGSEPEAQYMVRLIQTARQLSIHVVFVAPEFSSRSAEVVAQEIDGRVVVIDPLAEDYIPNMRAVAAAIGQVT